MTDQATYVAEIGTFEPSVESKSRFEVRAQASTALFCPLVSRTADIAERLSVSLHVTTRADEPAQTSIEKLQRITGEIYVDESDEGSPVLLLRNDATNRAEVPLPVDVWVNADSSVRIYDGLDELEDSRRQLVVNALDREFELLRYTNVIVTRRIDIAESCSYITYIEGDRPYTKRLDQGRKSFIVHVKPRSVVRKFYNENGDRRAKSLREIGFYLHYGHAEVLPRLVDHREGSHITIDYLPGQTIREIGVADEQSRIDLTRRFANSVVELFGDATPVTDKLKSKYFGGVGASDNLRATVNQLGGLAPHYSDCDPFKDLLARVEKIRVSNELLIKLDWNSSNTIVSENEEFAFVDFEQAFVGTPEMLIGVLLHNPDWCARTLVKELRNQMQVSIGKEELSNMVHLGFAMVLVDSVTRSGSPWRRDRIESAYERHVLQRLAAI